LFQRKERRFFVKAFRGKGCAIISQDAFSASEMLFRVKQELLGREEPEKLFMISSTCAYIINFIEKSIQSPITPRDDGKNALTTLPGFLFDDKKKVFMTSIFPEIMS
jgi:hypothetical protein